MNVELHLRSEDGDGAKLYEVTVDGKALLGIVGNDDTINVLAWDQDGEAITVWETTPDDLYDPEPDETIQIETVQTTGTYNVQTGVFTPDGDDT